jgi:hypothetical protein
LPRSTTTRRLRRAAFDPGALDLLPSAESLAGDPITTDPRDPDWAPPALTNQWAGLVAGRGVFSYAGLSTPDLYAASEHGRLFAGLGGGPLEDLSSAGEVTYRWYPSRVERGQEWRGLRLHVTTLIPTFGAAAVNLLNVSNPGGERASLDLFALVAADTAASWDTSWPPRDPVRARVRLEGETLLLEDRESAAASAVALSVPLAGVAGFDRQASGWVSAFEAVGDPFAPQEHVLTDPAPDDPRWREALAAARLDGRLDLGSRWVALHLRLELEPGGSADLAWAHALGADAAEATALARRCLREAPVLVERTRDAWEEEWRAAFGASPGRFSGHLPVLECDEEPVRRLYHVGALNLLYCKRTPAWGGPAETYVTGFPSSLGTFPHTWVFPWDTMMVAGVLSLLDPAVMRRMLLAFLEADLHRGCAIDLRSGGPVGTWYAVNDHAAVHMAWQYVRYTGDLAFLHEAVRGRSVLDVLAEHARYYRRLAGDDGLADYGTAANLLECVSSYTHKVASFNAANVWNGRTVAAMLRLAGRDEEAGELEGTAGALASAVLELYLPGEGYFGCRQPDGELVPVRHCLDFFTVLQCMPDALSPEQVEEMVAFFLRELKTRTWMHALSPLDPDAASSSRTDHQDEGAYTTWPAYSLEALLQTGHVREALEWVGTDGAPGLADVTRQGPFGQAYTHGDAGSPTVGGVAAKAPMEFPHIEKPVLLPGGRYAQLVVESLAGVRPALGGEVEVAGRDLPLRLGLKNLLLRGEDHALESGAA